MLSPLQSRSLITLLGTAFTLSLVGCFGSDDKEDDPTPADGVSNSLHYAFKGAAWNAFVPCDHLSGGVNASPLNRSPGVDYFPINSGSTNAVFHFAVPHDSATMAAAANLRKYPIFNPNSSPTQAFTFGLSMPAASAQDTMRLVSRPGLSIDSYSEVVSIKYVRSSVQSGRRYASFDVKGKYLLLAAPSGANAVAQPISGTYCIRFNTVTR